MGRKQCDYVSYDRATRRWIARRPSVRKVSKVFHRFDDAKNFAVEHLHSKTVHDAPNSRKLMVQLLRSMNKIYGNRDLLMPADLQDAMARHICDSDVFESEPAAEVLSIMLKYRLVRVAFSAALRAHGKLSKKRPLTTEDRAHRLWFCLQRVAVEAGKCEPQCALQPPTKLPPKRAKMVPNPPGTATNMPASTLLGHMSSIGRAHAKSH